MVLLILIAAVGWQPPDPTQQQQLEFLRLSYKSNFDSFAYGTFRFQYTWGLSASTADAEAEVFSKAFEESGFYVFDGANARYDLVADPKVLAAATRRISETRSSASIESFRSLTDGKFTLRDNHQAIQGGTAFRHGVIIHAGEEMFYRSDEFEFPLWIGGPGGVYDLYRDVTLIKDGDERLSFAELDMDARLDGAKVCKFSYTWKDGKVTYWIDLDRGSVPLRIQDHYNPNHLDTAYIHSDLVQVPDAGWLPRKRLRVTGPGTAIVDRIVVTEIDARTKPKPAVFELDFPEPVAAADEAKRLSYPPRKNWSLLHLPSASSKGVRPMMTPAFASAMPGEITPTPRWIIVLIATLIAAVALGAGFMVTRRMTRIREV